MHFTTRCSVCGTLFWIVNDQLKLSDGWVRCGGCLQVFDATLTLQKSPLSDGPSALGAVPVEAPVASRSAGLADTAPPARQQNDAIASTEAFDARGLDQPMGVAEPGSTHVASASLLDSRQDADMLEGAEPLDGQPEPGFVRQARRRAFWRSPGVRIGLFLSCMVLSALLVGQWAFHHRDRLAASIPAIAPWLSQACQQLGCTLSPVRQLESIAIDSTTLVHRLDNFYAFDIVLKNTAATPLAIPALELTLTRADDSVMARRVFLPQELPGAPVQISANASTTLNLRLALGVGEGLPMAGYRALIFYP
jgi:predicted Zn finger-like uncharacterized protein